MADIEPSIDIEAPPDFVFRFVARAWETDMGFWTAEDGVVDWTPIGPMPFSKGFRIEYVAKQLGVGFRMEVEVKEFDDGKSWSAFTVKGLPLRGDWRFQPIGESSPPVE